MTERAEKQDQIVGVSLWQDGLSRLKKNRMAVVGSVIVFVMGALALLADVLPLDPTTQHASLQDLPPFSTVLNLEPTMHFRTGELPPYPFDAVANGDTVVFETDPFDSEITVYRVKLRRGRVSSLKAELGAVSLDSVGVSGPGEVMRLLTTSDTFEFSDVTIVDGAQLPEKISSEVKTRAFTLEKLTVDTDRKRVRIALAGDTVAAVLVGGLREGLSPRDELVLEDRFVHDVRVRGERFTISFPLGSDSAGRDMLSRLIYGGRISLMVGLVATLVSLLIGVLYGSVSGYLGGSVDRVMMRLVDILYALPYMFLVIILLVTFGKNLVVLFVALGCVQWLTMARIVRGQVLSLKQKEFIEAAHTIGTPTWKIIIRHLIPNTIGTVVVYTTLTVPAVILQEAFLSFLGLNVEYGGLPLESWGALVNQGWKIVRDNHWPFIFSAFTLSVTLFSLNFLGDGLRDALDPQQRGRK